VSQSRVGASMPSSRPLPTHTCAVRAMCVTVEYGPAPRWKLLHYHVKDAFAPVGVSAFVNAEGVVTVGYSRYRGAWAGPQHRRGMEAAGAAPMGVGRFA
jgi:hypothetical protein